jgi:ketosteroid isomerase-like protein
MGLDEGDGDGVLEVADRMFRAIEDGDLAALRACYAPGVQVWTNFDDATIGVDDALRVVGWLTERLAERRYDVRRREVIDGGFLQEHVLRGSAPDGTEIAMPACIVARVERGAITVIHEYLDPSGVAALATDD